MERMFDYTETENDYRDVYANGKQLWELYGNCKELSGIIRQL